MLLLTLTISIKFGIYECRFHEFQGKYHIVHGFQYISTLEPGKNIACCMTVNLLCHKDKGELFRRNIHYASALQRSSMR